MNLGTILIYLFLIVLILVIFLLIWPFSIYIHLYAGLKKIHLKVQIRLTPNKFDIYKKEWKWASLYPNEEEEIENKINLKNLLKKSDDKESKSKGRANKLFKKFMKVKLEVYYFNWFTTFGLGNPATTSISYAALWIIKSLVFRYLTKRFKFDRGKENYIYDIQSDLENLNVSSQLDCILKLPRGYDILRIMLK